jgi:hypothetical protein
LRDNTSTVLQYTYCVSYRITFRYIYHKDVKSLLTVRYYSRAVVSVLRYQTSKYACT